MRKIGIFFGSDTGNTEKIAHMIHKKIGKKKSKIYDISQISEIEIKQFDVLIFGIPTWYYGELQCDWDEFIPILKNINFKNKIVALFGCGDQEDYSEYFCDAMGIVYRIIQNNRGNFIGKWPKIDYHFQSSKALIDEKNFVGLIIDEDRQPEKTKCRVSTWVTGILKELEKIDII